MLRPLLFITCINDLDVNLGGTVSKFADYTKIGDVVNGAEGYFGVQWDLDQTGQWVEKWQIEFNLDKYGVLHFGKVNLGKTNTLN
eukprot:g19677.t1